MSRSVKLATLFVCGVGLVACQPAADSEPAGDMASSVEPIAASPTQQKPMDVSATPTEMTDMSDMEKRAVARLIWVKDADAKADAKAALAGDTPPILHAFSGRMRSHPGLSPEEFEQIEARVTSTFVPGMGDVLHGETHKAMRRDVRDYAKAYNRDIYMALTSS